MVLMKLRSEIIILLFLLVLQVSNVHALSCGRVSACESYAKADAVFLGTATEVSEQQDGSARTRFVVKESFKGGSIPEVEIISESKENPWGYGGPRFKVGEDYLVIAFRNDQGQLSVSVCNPSLPLGLAVADLNFLRAQTSKKPPETILYGMLIQLGADTSNTTPIFSPLPAIRVDLAGPSGVMQTVSGSNGYFEFANIPRGTYKVTPALPDTLHSETREVKIEADGCAAAAFVTMWNGRIAGRAIRADGQPLAEAGMSLINLALPRGEGIVGRTDKEGRYEFDLVQPGRYQVGLLDSIDIPSDEHPLPPLFYPDAEDPGSAKVIEMGQGQKFDSIDFDIRSFQPRTIRVEVLWPDKKPAAGAHVFIEYEHSYCWKEGCMGAPSFTADQNGRVVFHAFGDGNVRVYAVAKQSSGAEWISEFGELNLQGLPFATTLVMIGDNPYGPTKTLHGPSEK